MNSAYPDPKKPDSSKHSKRLAIKFCNTSPATNQNKDKVATHKASQAFVDAILQEIKQGYGFVPFIGAGFSVAAGIPVLWQFHNYLQRCICAAVGAETEPDACALWNPRTDAWPPFIDVSQPDPIDPDQWRSLVWERWQNEKKKKNWRSPLYQEAHGAMAEWRTALHFLSRLDLDGSRDGSVRNPVLGVPNQDVIDACLRKVLRANSPSLNHVMLATLSQVLRIDVILTTNFDDLVEKAFEHSRNRLEVFDVHLDDKLPDFNAVSRVRSIVKIHGSQNSLRADYSLDGPPAVEDQETFASYVCGKNISGKWGQHQTRNHLIVFGVGVRERRTRGFLTYALRELPDLKIFFVCFQPSDVEQVMELVKHYNAERREGSPGGERCFVVRHTESGLLLLHLYQWFRKTLPHSSAVFPSTTRLSLPPLPGNTFRNSTYRRFVTKLNRTLTNLNRTDRDSRLVIASSQRPVYGVTSAAAEVFRTQEVKNLCLWIEMHDIHNADDLFEAFQEAAYRKLGETDWTPLFSFTDTDRDIRSEVERIAKASSKPIIVFVDAREIPGANRNWPKKENGWLDLVEYQGDFKTLLEALCKKMVEEKNGKKIERKASVRVVLLCREAADSTLTNALTDLQPKPNRLESSDETDGGEKWNEARIVKEVICWANDKEKRAFLNALLTFQRSRHFAVIWNRCTNPDGTPWNEAYDTHKNAWLYELCEKTGVVRRKDGGFIWFDSFFRERLRACPWLTTDNLSSSDAVTKALDIQGKLNDKELEEFRSAVEEWAHDQTKGNISGPWDINLQIAMWYVRLFESTGTSRAILEAIDHMMFAVDYKIRHPNKSGADQMCEQLAAVIDSARHLLREHSFLLQTDGHPLATKRRLEYIRDYWIMERSDLLRKHERADVAISKISDTNRANTSATNKAKKNLLKAVSKLQCAAVEVSRAICREIGLDRDAYRLHREISVRMVYDKPFSTHRKKDEDYKDFNSATPASNYAENLSKEIVKKWVKRQRHLVRWWRWSGMLGMQSRSFAPADRALCHALSVSILDADPSPSEEAAYLLKPDSLLEWERGDNLDKLKLPSPPPGSDSGKDYKTYRLHLEMLHAIEVSSCCLAMKANTLQRREMLSLSGTAGSAVDNLKAAEALAVKGLRLIDQIQSGYVPDGQHDTDLTWLKSRLLMAAALASLWDSDRKTASVHAMSLLGNAAACLHSTMSERAGADIALIELRRADVRLQEAGGAKLVTEKNDSFEQWTYGRLTGPVTELVKAVNTLKANATEDTVASCLKQVKASATDALRFLDRALPTLHRMRRNVWWTTWYFERRLRAISLISWASLIEGGDSPIPYFGLESAMAGADTEADTLLMDATRMIRVDAYRLAMILLAYASCCRAMEVRLMTNTKEPGLEKRVQRMRDYLKSGRYELVLVNNRRASDGFGTPMPSDDPSHMDSNVKEVVETILKLTESILEEPLRTST